MVCSIIFVMKMTLVKMGLEVCPGLSNLIHSKDHQGATVHSLPGAGGIVRFTLTSRTGMSFMEQAPPLISAFFPFFPPFLL